MPNGIIYIARNNSNPSNHYKIGKSDRADPALRMRELTSDTTNYQGEFYSKGYVLVSEVDECERLVHETLNYARINNRREFFDINLDEAIKIIRQTLKDNIIQDFFVDEINEIDDIELQSGDRDKYKYQNHILNFIEPSEHWGVDGDAIEAAAFAWLAHRRLNNLPGNAIGVTGAEGERVLGAIY